ncbi:MAG: hypothetical protein KF812_05430 [Fimbriimonadaceae bacterium]|nr:hypothetical protein [Fimbriimonadaceae bacterium]
MEYMVIATDGNEYGPVDYTMLSQWVLEKRVLADSHVKQISTGRIVRADAFRDLFPVMPSPQVQENAVLAPSLPAVDPVANPYAAASGARYHQPTQHSVRHQSIDDSSTLGALW